MKESTEEVVPVSKEPIKSPYIADDAASSYENICVEANTDADIVPKNAKDSMVAIHITVFVPISQLRRRTIVSFVEKKLLREKIPYEKRIRCQLSFEKGCRYIKRLVEHNGMMHLRDIVAQLPRCKRTVEHMLGHLLKSGDIVKPLNNGIYMAPGYLEKLRSIPLDTTTSTK